MRPHRNWTLALLTILAVGLSASGDTASARPGRSPVLHVGMVGAWMCDRILLVTLNLETLDVRQWSSLPDDGREDVQLREISGRSGPFGQWYTLGSASGGEGRRRFAGMHELTSHGTHFDGMVRIVRTDGSGITSSAQPWTDGCPTA